MTATSPVFLMHADGGGSSRLFVNRGVDQTAVFTPRGNVAISNAQSKFGGGALAFNPATGDSLEVTRGGGNAGFVLDSGDFTIECWVYPTLLTGNKAIVARWQGTSYLLFLANGLLSFDWAPFSVNGPLIQSTVAVTANQWSHVAVTRSGNTWSLWQNGNRVAQGTSATNAAAAPTVPTTIGAYYDNPATPLAVFSGFIDEVRIVNDQAVYDGTQTTYTVPTAAFTAPYPGTQVSTALMEVVGAGVTPPVPPVFLMHADGSDFSGKLFVNRGSDQSVAFLPKGNPSITTARSKFGGGSLLFDPATSDSLEVTQGAGTAGIVLDSGDFTIECWVYPTASTGDRGLVARWQSQSYIFFMSDGVLKFNWAPFAIGSALMVSSGPVVPLNQWSHLAVTRKGNSWALWQNGQRVATVTNASNATSAPNIVTTLGCFYNANGLPYGTFSGNIDEIRILKGVAAYDSTQATYAVPATAFVSPYIGTTEKTAALEIVSASSAVVNDRALIALNESVILGSPDGYPRVSSSALEIVGTGVAPIPDPGLFSLNESVLLSTSTGLQTYKASLEVVGAADYDWRPVAKVRAMRTSVLTIAPKPTRVSRAALEIVGLNPNYVATRALYSINELVLLSANTDRTSKVRMEIVAASDVVPPTNKQFSAWFTSQ